MPNPAYIATVKANGQNYTAFETITVKRSISNGISYFELTCSEGGPLGSANDARRLVPGTPVQILLGGKLALTGAVTTRSADFGPSNHVVLLGGRSLTANSVDSDMPVQPGNFDGYTGEQAIRGALKPGGVNLTVVNPPPTWSKPFPYLAANPGEHVSEFIEKVCKMRGAFIWDDEQGNLVVGQANASAASVADLQEGRNILRATIKLDDQSIYSAISFYGQQPAQNDDYTDRSPQGTAMNSDANNARIAVGHAEHVGDSSDMTTRANLESSRSGWDQVEASITVAGWFRPDGQLWQPTDSVTVYSPMGFPNGTGKMNLGVQAVTYSQTKDDEGEGTTTTLTLVRKEFLFGTPLSGVSSDGSGGYGPSGSTPSPAQAVPPDYTQGSAGPGGLLGHI